MQENTWTNEEVKRFWDYQSTIPENYFTYQIGDRLVDFFDEYINKADLVLDYGAGEGFFSEQILKKTDAKIACCDISPESTKTSQARCEKYSNFQGAYIVNDLIQKNMKFDLIFCFEVIEHCNDKYLNMTFDNFKQLLSPNGLIITSTPNNEDLRRSFIACPHCGKVFHRWQHEKTYTKETLAKYITEKGFDIVDLYATNFTMRKKRGGGPY